MGDKWGSAESLPSGPSGFNQMLGSKTQVYADCSMQPNDLLINDPYFGASTFNQLLLTPSNSQNPGCIVASQQLVDLINHHQYLAQNQENLHKPLSKDQKRRLRLKEKEQEKDGQLASLISETEMLKQQILRTNYELSYLRSENEMLRSVKDEQFVCLRSQNEMLRSYYEQLAQLISEIEMLRTNKDEQLARLVWETEMLRKEIASIKN